MKITRKELRRLIKEVESKSAPFGSGMSQAKLDQDAALLRVGRGRVQAKETVEQSWQ